MEEGVEEDAYERVDRKEGAESSITKELDLASAWKCNCSEGHCAGKNNVWRVTDSVRVRADFESGNVSKAEPGSEGSEFDLCIWTAPDNEGTRWEARSSSWFYFVVTSFYEAGSALTIQVRFTLSLIEVASHLSPLVLPSCTSHRIWCYCQGSGFLMIPFFLA